MLNKSEAYIMKEWNSKEIGQPLVSICCITYNHEKFIEECLDSLLIQETSFPFEVLICDDASTDKTPNIINKYEQKYPQIIKPIYQKTNQFSKGIRVNFKFNFPRVKGKYVALCEGDDYWIEQQKLSKQVNFMENNMHYVVCTHNTKILYEDVKRGKDDFIVNNAIKDTYDVVDLTKGEIYFHTSSMLYRNIVFNNFSSKYMTDYLGDWFILILHATKGYIKYIDEVMSVYRIHSRGRWSKITDSEQKITNLKAILKFNEVFDYKYEENFLPLFIRSASKTFKNVTYKDIEDIFEATDRKSLIKIIFYLFETISEKDLFLLNNDNGLQQRIKGLYRIYLSRRRKAIQYLKKFIMR